MSLREIKEKKQDELFQECGAFFAFGQEQFESKRKDGVKYTSLDFGLICESDKIDKLLCGLEKIHKEAIAEDLRVNGKSAIIQRELANHEAQITMSTLDTFEAFRRLRFYRRGNKQ